VSGETEGNVSGWTVDTLAAFIEQRLADLQVLLNERKQSQETAMSVAFAAQTVAIDKALIAINERLHLLNELRDDVATKTQLEALEKELAALTSRLDRNEGRGAGLNAGWVYLLAGIAAIGTLVSIFLAMRGGA